MATQPRQCVCLCVSGGEGVHECVSVVRASPSPFFSSSSSSQSVSQPLLRVSMLGNSSLEFPWTCSRPPLPSLLPLSPTVLPSFSPSHPPASPSPCWLFHWGAIRVCVCGRAWLFPTAHTVQLLVYLFWSQQASPFGRFQCFQHHLSSELYCWTIFTLAPV